MKANLLTFVRGLRNGTSPRLQSYLKSLILLLGVVLSVNLMATDFTLSSASSVTEDGITVSFAQNGGGNAPTWYSAGLRLYPSNTVTISSDKDITAITFNWEKQGSKAFASASASVGNYSHPSAAAAGTWTGSAKSVTFTLGSSGQLQLNTFSVTAAAAANPYTVTFNGNGHGTPAKASEKEESAGAGVTLPSVTADEGYKFLGWATTSGATTADAGAAGATYKPSKDITLYAVYKQLYKVTLWRNGSSTTTDWIEDDSYTLPTNETAACEEWPFKGWSTSTVPSTTTAPSFKTSASKSSTTFYAVYGKTVDGGFKSQTETEHMKTSSPYVSNTGWTASAGGTYTTSGNYGASSPSIKLTANNQYIQSTTFSGYITAVSYWYKSMSASGSIKFYASTDGSTFSEISGEAVTLSSSATGTKSITLQASSKYKAIKVLFNRSSGNLALDDIAVTYDAPASTTTYTTSPDCAEKYSISSNITGQGSILWSLDGETFGETIAKQPENTGIYFKLVPTSGWNIDGTPSLSPTGDIVDYGDGIYGFEMPASAVSVTASFKQPAKYIVYYDKGNFASAVGDVPEITKVDPGTNYSVNTTDKLSLTGYTFKGWNTDKNATTGLTNITVNDDITLYAIFTINSYNITFTPSITGGSIKVNNSSTSPISVQYNSNVTITVTPTSKYFKLATLTYNNADIKDTKQFAMPAENVEIAYSFTEDPKVTVTFKNNGETLTTDGTREVYVNDPIGTLPTLTSSDAKDSRSKTFVGWTTDKLTNWQATSPTLVSASTTVTEALELNAVWAKEGEGGTYTNQYKKITSTADFTDGDYMIVGSYSESYNYALNSDVESTNFLKATSVNIDNNTINNTNNKLIWTATKKSGDETKISLRNVSNGNYLSIVTYTSSNKTYYNLKANSADIKYFTYSVNNGVWKFVSTDYAYQVIYTYYTSTYTDEFATLEASSNPTYPLYLFKRQKNIAYSDYITHSSSSRLASITLNTDNVKKDYFVGEDFTSADLSAMATLEDETITFQIDPNDLIITPADLSTDGTKEVTVSYTFNGATKSATYYVNAYSVTINSVYTDRVDDEPVTGNTYSWNPETHALTFTKQAHYKFNGIEVVGADKTGSNLSYTLSNPIADVTLTATWQRLFTLQYNSKGGAAVSSVTDVTKNTPVSTMPTPKYTGYNLVGWFDNEGYTGDAVTFPYAITKDETLYAKWEVKTTTITLSQADATTKGKEEVVATYGQPMPEATMPQREHYQFAGYKLNSTLYYDANGSSARDWDKEDATATLTAQWIINKNKVIFTNVLDGGTIKVNNQTSTINEVDYNSTVTITATPSAHYTLTALTYQVGENTPVSIKDNPSFKMPDADVTIAATFTEDPKVTVTWHIGAGSQETEGVYVGSTYSLLTPPEVADDAAGDCATKFMGWATEAISTPTDAAGFEAIQVSDDIVISESQKDFYAVFAALVGTTPSSYTIAFANNTTGVTEISTTTQASTIIAADSRTYVTTSPVSSTSKSYYGGSGIEKTSIRVGASSSAGNITLALSENGQVKADKISVNTQLYNSTKAATLSVNSSATQSIPATADNLEYSQDGSLLTAITLATSKYAYINSLTVYYEDKEYGNYITQCCTPWTPTLSYANTTMQVGEEQDAVVGTTHGTATYISSNPSSVEVNETTGHIKAVGGGTATISVTWTGDDTYCEQSTSSQEITVNGSLQVIFNGNGADGGTTMNPQMVEYGVATNLNKNTYTKTGYTFQGWAETSEATSIKYTDEESVTFIAGVELFAVWSINAHKVIIQDATGGTIAITPTTTTIDYNTTVTATATLASGYNFVSWSATPAVTFADATNKSTTFSMPDNDVILKASYTPILVTKIDLKKGAEVVTALEFEKDVTNPITLTTAFTPADALVKTVTWQSGNTNIVTAVDGILTAQGLGTAVVTATSTVVPSVYGSVTVTVYEWQDADPKYTLTNQPASTVYYETNKIDFADWTIKHNFKRSDDATKTKQEDVASSNWTVTLGGEVIANNYTLTTSDNGKALVIKVGETELYNQTLTVNEKAKHTYIDRVHGNEPKVMIDNYTIPSLNNTAAKTEGSCDETHYVFKGWAAEADADAPTDENIIAAGGSAEAEADATFYAVWAERRNVTTEKTMSYGWESTDSKTGWTISGSTSSFARTGSKSGSVTGSGDLGWVNCIATTTAIEKPKSITCYYSKNNNNNNSSSYWAIEVKTSAGGNWQEIQEGYTYNNVTKNQWYELSADLTSYTNIIVAVNAKTTASDRLIDDVVLTYEVTEPKDVDYITECVTRYDLSFNANGGEGKVPETIKLKEGGKVALPGAELAKVYNDFNGWNTQADRQGTHYAVGDEYTMGGENATLYADWAPLAVTALEITSEATNTEFGIGQTFSADGLTVMATYEGGDTEENVAFTTNYDNHVFTATDEGNKPVTVSYKGFSADLYNITVAPALIVRFFVNGTQIQEKSVFDKKIGAMPNAMTSDAWKDPENEFIASHYPIFAGWTLATSDDDIEFINEGTNITTNVDVNAAFAEGYSVTSIASTASGVADLAPGNRYVIGVTVGEETTYYQGTKDNSDWANMGALETAEIVTVLGKGAPYAIQQTNGKYIDKKENDRPFLLVENAVYAISITDDKFIKYGDGEYYLSRNTNSGITNTGLRWYATGDKYPKAFLYKAEVTYDHLTIAPNGDHSRTGLTMDKAGTICLPYAVKADDYKGASVWSIESRTGTGTMISSITLVQEVDNEGKKNDLVAGKPYIFFAEESEFQLFYSGDPVAEVEAANGLVGNLDAQPIIINEGTYQPGSYLINQNKLMECGANCQVPQYRAYVEAEKIGATPVQAPISAPRRVIGNPSGTPTNLNGLNGNVKAQKALIDGHIYILRDNKMYNAQGIKIQ